MKKAFFQLHLAVFLAGFTGILGRLIDLNEGLLVWYRLFISAATMWVLYLSLGRIQKRPPREVLKITGVGLIAAMHWVTFYGAIKYANVSVALVCFSAIGFFTAIFEPVIVKRKLNKTELFLGLLVIAGIYIIFQFDARYKTGIIAGLISAVLGSLFPIFNRQFLQRMNVETLISYELTGGLLTLSCVLPFYLHFFPAKSFVPDWESLLWLLVLAWVCSVWAFQLSSNALKRVSAFTVNLTYNLEPVYGILLAFMLFKENKYLSHWFYTGFALIAAALLIHLFLLLREEKKLATAGTTE
ncbi:MAG TPA: DMT family transporter [Chitinophagaceae bacterium]|jgi:drug/metabolite transporter (DMT)-like permease|nr:DMT family transporter [Chitinophagaceae bacterium]